MPQLLSQVSKAKDGNGKYDETMLQELIHRCPGALPVGDFYPSVTSLISLGREVPVDVGSGTGFIDNLFVTDDAHLVLVETKLSRNPEATREVVAQTLQYGMAISRLSLDQFEACLRRASSKSDRLGAGETLVQRINKVAPEGFQIDLANGFEEAFNSSRRAGEILLLIVTHGIHSSAERLVQWMNELVGSAPYKFGLVELGIYDLPDGGRVVIPKTRLRITEASRHVVTVLTQVAGPDLSYTVTEADEAPRKGVAASPPAITDEALIQKIRAGNPPEVYALVEKLRVLLNSISPRTRATPTEIQYGVDVKEDFIPLLHFSPQVLWFQIPIRAVRSLGPEKFVICKQKINSVALFYRAEDVADPDKVNALNPRYEILLGKVEAFVEAFSEVAEMVRDAAMANS